MYALRLIYSFIAISIFSIELPAQSVLLKNAREAPRIIAIQEFLSDPANPATAKPAIDLESTLAADLLFSRIFKVLTSETLLEPKVSGPIQIIKVDTWKQMNARYVTRAKVSRTVDETALEGFVFDIETGKLTLQRTYRTKRTDINILSHQFGDDIVEVVTGRKGLFSTKIAFAYIPPKKKNKEIWTMDFNGRNAKPLIENGRVNMSPAWSVDGRLIFFSASSTIDWNIWKTDLNGNSRQITSFHGSAIGPAAMPNGRELVVSLSKDGNQDIYLINLEGKIVKQLTAKRGINVAPFPSPDGKHICFSSDRLGNLHVFKLDMITMEDRRLTRVGTLNDSCVWSPTDNLILFSGMDTDREFDIFAMDDKGEGMDRLTYDAKTNESPSFSPDGNLFTFSSKRSGRNQIYVMKSDGTQETIIDLPGDASQPAWSPRLGY